MALLQAVSSTLMFLSFNPSHVLYITVQPQTMPRLIPKTTVQPTFEALGLIVPKKTENGHFSKRKTDNV